MAAPFPAGPSVGQIYQAPNGVTYVYNGTTWDGQYNAAFVTAKTSNTGSSVISNGTTAQRDAPASAGYLRWNTTTSGLEVYDGAAWGAVGGGSYTLPIATTTVLGGVKVDGSSITITAGGVITSVPVNASSGTVPVGGLAWGQRIGSWNTQIFSGLTTLTGNPALICYAVGGATTATINYGTWIILGWDNFGVTDFLLAQRIA